MTNLIRWQTHRYVLRQSMTYFANDFAGRIASNIVQSAASLRDSTVQVIDALWFVTVFSASALAILAEADWRLTAAAGRLDRRLCRDARRFRAAHPQALRVSGASPRRAHRPHRRQLHQHPGGEAVRPSRARGRARARGAGRAHRRLSSPDAAHHADESLRLVEQRRACRRDRRGRRSGFGRRASRRSAQIAIAAGLAIRITTMSGWVMWTAIGIFDNVGQVQEGMRTIARPQTLVDADGATELDGRQGRNPLREGALPLRQEGRRDRRSVVHDRAGRKGRAGRPLGRGQVDAGQSAAALLRRRERTHPDRRPGHRSA